MRGVAIEPIDESVVMATAEILGQQSAAAKALTDAQNRRAAGQHVEFFKSGKSILVRGTTPNSDNPGA